MHQPDDARHLERVPIAHLHTNTWNPNVMDDRQTRAVRESIEAFGFVDPVTVRPHPTEEGYEIIDGEHRVAEARKLGYHELPVVVLDVDTTTAQRLTAIFIESRGEPDPVRMGELAAELESTLGAEAMVGLPWSDTDMARMLRIAEMGLPPGPEAREGEWVRISALVPANVRVVWDAAMERAKENGWQPPDTSDAAITNGQLLEIVCAEYLANLT